MRRAPAIEGPEILTRDQAGGPLFIPDEDAMPRYRVEARESWTQVYEVEAENKEEAIRKIVKGGGTAIDNALEFVEFDDRNLESWDVRETH